MFFLCLVFSCFANFIQPIEKSISIRLWKDIFKFMHIYRQVFETQFQVKIEARKKDFKTLWSVVKEDCLLAYMRQL